MNKIKKIIGGLIISTTMLSNIAGISASASTGTTTVSNITVAPASSGVWNYTPTRSKDNNSKVYLYISSGNVSAAVKVCGTNESSDVGGINCTLNNDGSGTSYIGTNVGGSYYIKNSVRNQFNYVNLGFQSMDSNRGGTNTISWAPDSYVY